MSDSAVKAEDAHNQGREAGLFHREGLVGAEEALEALGRGLGCADRLHGAAGLRHPWQGKDQGAALNTAHDEGEEEEQLGGTVQE